jgi:restriction system protein
MKNYYQVRLGEKSVYAEKCFAGNFIGTDYDIHQDLTGKLPEDWPTFNKAFIPVYLAARRDKTKIAAGLACGATWTVSKGILKQDVVLCPDGTGRYRVGEVIGDYYYAPGEILFHRRPVRWLNQIIDRADMSEELQNSTGSIGAVSKISRPELREEIEKLIGGAPSPAIISTDPTVEDASAFALEKHLEDFLMENWSQTDLGRDYDIYREDGEPVGQQYQTDTGPLDILAISKDKKRLLVVELKKGRASDSVVGQTLRYMSYVQEELAEPGQTVHGAIIAHEDDQRIRRALAMTSNIGFYRYEISFKLVKS